MKKLLAGAIILMFIGMSLNPSNGTIIIKKLTLPTLEGNILYVGGYGPGNYTHIQDAIDNASEGDILFVYNGTYYEFNITIDKTIRLIGEDRFSTIIDAESGGNFIIIIYANKVNISGFTIQKSGYAGCGISLNSSNGNTIVGNKINSNWYGIELKDSHCNTIVDNVISNTSVSAIEFKYSSNNMIESNNISDNNNGFYLNFNSNNNTFTGNKILDNYVGLDFRESNDNSVKNNIIANNGDHTWVGIRFYKCDRTIISRNTILNNNGLFLVSSDTNIITDNSFINDGLRVWTSYQNVVYNNTVNEKPLVYLENKSDIVIDDAGQVILIECDNITVQSLDLSNTDIGIQLWDTNSCIISSNGISNNENGINLYSSSDNIITSNTISDNNVGIWFWEYSFDNIITDNIISENIFGILLQNSNCNTISHNNITSNIYYGIVLSSSVNNSINCNDISNNNDGIGIHLKGSYNTITDNHISNNSYGIYVLNSSNTIKDNHISNNKYGIYLLNSNNIIYHNKFINNEHNAKDKSSNAWNDRYPFGGNFWDDYNGIDNFSGPNQDIPGSDGIGDTPYPVPGEWQSNNEDKYPLMEPWVNQLPSVEILNPRKGYFHFSGIPLIPTLYNLIADTISIGGFRLRPIIIMATDDIDHNKDLIVKIHLNGEERGNASYCYDWKLYEWFWIERAFGKYILTITTEDSYGKIGVAEMKIWNFCLLS